MDAALRDLVRERANKRCEYCRFPDEFSRLTFHTDHIIPQKHGGDSSAENLAWACFDCNVFKGANLSGIDPSTRRMVRLFNPRGDPWHLHFRWNEAELTGVTAIGRATISVLKINSPMAIVSRRWLMSEGIHFD